MRKNGVRDVEPCLYLFSFVLRACLHLGLGLRSLSFTMSFASLFLVCCSLRLAFPDSGLKAHFALPTPTATTNSGVEQPEHRKDKADVQNMQNSANALYLWSSMAAIETYSPVYP